MAWWSLEVLKVPKWHFEKQSQELTEKTEYIASTLIRRLDLKAEPIEERLLEAETIRNAMWTLLSPKLNQAMADKNWTDILEAFNDFYKLQLALAQIMTKSDKDIFTGLGTFLNFIPTGMVPQALWGLILLLKRQGRLTDMSVTVLVEQLGRSMERSLDE